jgi:hypothetical protein
MGADYQYFDFQEDINMFGHFQLPFANQLFRFS